MWLVQVPKSISYKPSPKHDPVVAELFPFGVAKLHKRERKKDFAAAGVRTRHLGFFESARGSREEHTHAQSYRPSVASVRLLYPALPPARHHCHGHPSTYWKSQPRRPGENKPVLSFFLPFLFFPCLNSSLVRCCRLRGES